jgi:CRISPR type IV-associated protein Csf1
VLQPIEAPYVAIWNTRQQAHMIWRTPVSIPCERFREVRLDDEIFLIDRERVMRCVHHWHTTHAILKTLGKPQIFAFDLKWDLASTTVGQPRERLVEAVRKHSKEGSQAIDALMEMTLADWWAFFSIRDVSMADPGSWPTLSPVDP